MVPLRIDVLAGSFIVDVQVIDFAALRAGPRSILTYGAGRVALSCASICPTASSGMIHRSLLGSFLAGI
jgi:hypothetical protein